MNNLNIKLRIKDLREEKSITQTKLAQETKIKQANISRWESGLNTPNLSDLWILADYFGVSIDYLTGFED